MSISRGCRIKITKVWKQPDTIGTRIRELVVTNIRHTSSIMNATDVISTETQILGLQQLNLEQGEFAHGSGNSQSN
jgi:hypothetical protein